MRSIRTPRGFLSCVLAAGAVWLMFFVIARMAWICDDAFITFRTVDNALGGYGLTWNTTQRVQTYTHPLWMFLHLFVGWFSREVLATTLLISLVCTTGMVVLFAIRVARSYAITAMSLLILSSSPSFVDFSTSGLENALTHLLIVALWAQGQMGAHRPESLRNLAFVTALLGLNRPDSVLFALPVLVGAIVGTRRAGASFRELAVSLTIGLSPLIAWEVFSVIYYGFPFPNTYYAKVHGGVPREMLIGMGAGYFGSSFLHDPGMMLVVGSGVVLTLVRGTAATRLLALGIVINWLYILSVGGDFMRGRFFTPSFVAAVCAWAIFMRAKTPHPKRRLTMGALATYVAVSTSLSLLHSPYYEEPLHLSQNVDGAGTTDEREFYRSATEVGLLFGDPEALTSHHLSKGGIEMRSHAERSPATMGWAVGMGAFHAGPRVPLGDLTGVTDPLLARLPVRPEPYYRPGHFPRDAPIGYPESLAANENLIEDPEIRAFYDELLVVISGDIWSWNRFEKIIGFQTRSIHPPDLYRNARKEVNWQAGRPRQRERRHR